MKKDEMLEGWAHTSLLGARIRTSTAKIFFRSEGNTHVPDVMKGLLPLLKSDQYLKVFFHIRVEKNILSSYPQMFYI